MRALVTGGGGFVGRHLLRSLLGDGVEVWAGALDAISGADSGVHWVPLDVTDAASVRAAVSAARPHEVYHLAGQSSVAGSFRDPLTTWEVNTIGTVRVLEALDAGTAFVLASSAEVYGDLPEAAQPIAERASLRPASPYAASKAAAEMACISAARTAGIRAVIARSFNHTGPGQDDRFALASFARQLREMPASGGVLCVGNLEARRDLLDVRDVIRAYRRLAESGQPGEAYNVCSGRAVSIRHALDLLIEAAGLEVEIKVDPERVRPLDVPLLMGDPGRMAALGWSPEIPLEQTLRDLLRAACPAH